MNLEINADRGREVAALLYKAFSSTGIYGRTAMPEDITPEGVERGSLEHLLFITLTVSIDYQRNADQLWKAARKTFEDPETAYLFDPKSLHKIPREKQIKDSKNTVCPKGEVEISGSGVLMALPSTKSGAAIQEIFWRTVTGTQPESWIV